MLLAHSSTAKSSKRILTSILLTILLGIFLGTSSVVAAYTTHQPAAVVVGQSDFESNSINAGGSVSEFGFSGPRDAIIAEGKLLVVDGENKRVLIWNTVPTTAGVPADVVIGNTTMSSGSSLGCTPNGLNLADSGILYVNGKLILADSGQHRVLIYNSIPTSNGANANVVIGQTDLTTCSSGSGNNKMFAPTDIASDGTKLFISDTGNNRILIYNTIPTGNGAIANVVVGQPDFATISPGTTQTKLSNPRGIAVFDNKLIVGERGNFRATIFDPVPTSNGAPATLVLGQTNFDTATTSPPSTASTVHPFFLEVDPLGRLFIADRNSSRYLIWNSIPVTDNTPADVVIGQPDFVSTAINNGGISASSVNLAKGVFANTTQMVIADQGNNRVLIYNDPVPPPSPSPQPGQAHPAFSAPSPAQPPGCGDWIPAGVPDLFQINRTQNATTLYFTPTNDNVQHYHVIYGFEQGDERFGSLSNTISQSSNQGVQNITISSLDPSTEYWFKVAPVNGCAVGSWSSWLKVGKWRNRESLFYRY